MDPNTNLRDMLFVAQLINEIRDRCDDSTGEVQEDDLEDLQDRAFDLAELVESLNGWLKRGGYLPQEWEQ